MKSIEYPILLNPERSKSKDKPINKKVVYYLILLITAIGGFFSPVLFIGFGLLAICGLVLYCHSLYKEISSIDFSSDKYSITLEEIIEDLEG